MDDYYLCNVEGEVGMKKIVISINTSWNVFNFRLELCKELQKKGFKIIVVAPTDEYSQKLVAMGIEHHNINIHNKGTNPFEDIVLTYKYFLLYRKIKPDITLHFTIKPDIYATFAAGLLHLPIITNITGLGSLFIHRSLSLKVAKLLYKVALKFTTKVFFQNIEDMHAFVYHKLVDRSKVGLLPGSGIDPQKFKPQQHTVTKNTPFRFLMIARLVQDKGILEYVKAAESLQKKYPHIEFQVLGALYEDNPTAITSKQLQEWVTHHIITYLGHTDNVIDVIAQSSCVVLPSYREGMSRILLEAASMNRPLIASNVPGCMEVIDDGVNGYLCHVADYKDLAHKMEKMLNLDFETRAIMGEHSRNKILEYFSEDIVIDKYLTTIETILHDKS
jgi:glycosyltransferase involved in cell wall biosynthesis